MCVFSFYLQLIMINIPQDSMGGISLGGPKNGVSTSGSVSRVSSAGQSQRAFSLAGLVPNSYNAFHLPGINNI